MPKRPGDGDGLVFSGPTLRVEVGAEQIVVARTGWLARWRGGMQTIERQRLREARLLPWGGALLLVTDDRAHTLELGAQAEAALLAILGSTCAETHIGGQDGTLADESC